MNSIAHSQAMMAAIRDYTKVCCAAACLFILSCGCKGHSVVNLSTPLLMTEPQGHAAPGEVMRYKCHAR
jgi:hypothetical protein